jgi:protein O-GlcNAc transferase
MATILELLQQGVALQNAGRVAEAASCYDAVLRADPRQADALHLLGLVHSAQGNHQRGAELIQQALEVMPNNATFLGNLGVVLRNAGRIDDAIAAYRQSLELTPGAPDIHFNLGKSLKLKGDLAAAEQEFRRAIEIDPRRPSPYLSLTNVYAERGDVAGAIEVARQAAERCPSSIQAHLNLGVMLKRAELPEESLASYRRAVEAGPNNVEALCKLGSTLIGRHKLEEGRALIERARALAPDDGEVHNALGIWCKTVGDPAKAVEAFRKSIACKPDNGAAHGNLAMALKDQGRLSEALEHVDQGLALQPGSRESLVNKGAILMSLGRLDEAETCLRGALDAKSIYLHAYDSLLMCQQYKPGVTLAALNESHRKWNQVASIAPTQLPRSGGADPDRPLRLGFVSPDLGCHPVGYFTVRLFEALKRLGGLGVSTTIYSDRGSVDPVGARIKASVDQWHESTSWDDQELVAQIQRDQIDVLFDLVGHTAYNRLKMFAGRAAPLQITWAGYVGTTGLSDMDCLLADGRHVPDGAERHYSERVLRMPHGYICYDAPTDAAVVTPLPALERGFVQFAAMCNPAKVNAEVLQVWGRLLQAVPQGRLLLCYGGWPDAANQARVRKALVEFGCQDRVRFEHQEGYLNLMARYGRVDIALDTFPYSGGLTTCEALWMGVPTITWPGETFAGRHSLSHLTNVGLADWAVASADEYVEKARAWANDLDRLAALRSALREKVANSPLCDGERFARDFARVIREAWREEASTRAS